MRPARRAACVSWPWNLWKENEWEERYRAAATPSQQTPVWVLSALGTVIAAALLRATMVPTWAIVLCVLTGTALSCFFLVKGQKAPVASPVPAQIGIVVSTVVGYVFLLLVAIPLVSLGVLFIGCTVCH